MSEQMERVRVTSRQFAIMEFIRVHTLQKGYSPTNAEIAEHFEFSSVNAAVDHLRALLSKGCITKARGKNRSIVVTDVGRNAWIGARHAKGPA